MTDVPVLDPGLQRERTALAWTRTALGLVGNGVLVVVRHERSLSLPVTVALSGLALLVAVIALVAATLRSRIQLRPDHLVAPAYGYVVSLGVLMILLSGATAVAVTLPA